MSKWSCSICGYVYDEAKEGIPFGQLPEDWVCPLCGAGKSAFALQEAAPAPRAPAVPIQIPEGDMTELSPGALSVLCSNLARGCEKQYKGEEASLFRELAEFFSAAAPREDPAELSALLARVEEDLNTGYPTLNAAARAVGDRGAQRICVWGEKVTRILQSLLQRYEKEGEAFLENTQVWVCSVCGFVYVGDMPPELCPVCKVPAWKFDKVEGRG